MAPRTHKNLATYYCWPDLLYGPDCRPGAYLWSDASTELEVVAETVSKLPEAVVVTLRKRSGALVHGYLPGGLGV